MRFTRRAAFSRNEIARTFGRRLLRTVDGAAVLALRMHRDYTRRRRSRLFTPLPPPSPSPKRSTVHYHARFSLYETFSAARSAARPPINAFRGAQKTRRSTGKWIKARAVCRRLLQRLQTPAVCTPRAPLASLPAVDVLSPFGSAFSRGRSTTMAETSRAATKFSHASNERRR